VEITRSSLAHILTNNPKMQGAFAYIVATRQLCAAGRLNPNANIDADTATARRPGAASSRRRRGPSSATATMRQRQSRRRRAWWVRRRCRPSRIDWRRPSTRTLAGPRLPLIGQRSPRLPLASRRSPAQRLTANQGVRITLRR